MLSSMIGRVCSCVNDLCCNHVSAQASCTGFMMVSHAGGVEPKQNERCDSLGTTLVRLFSKRPAATTMKACREGEEGDNFYVVESGQFKVTKVDGDKEKLLFTYHGEGAFGELALMYNCPRAATVVVCDISVHCISFPFILLLSRATADAVNVVLLMYKAVCMCWLEVVLTM